MGAGWVYKKMLHLLFTMTCPKSVIFFAKGKTPCLTLGLFFYILFFFEVGKIFDNLKMPLNLKFLYMYHRSPPYAYLNKRNPNVPVQPFNGIPDLPFASLLKYLCGAFAP